MIRVKGKRRVGGCLFFAATCIVSCVLLITNQSVVAAVHGAAAATWPGALESKGSRQFFLFVGPVVILFAEWWLIDTLFWPLKPEPDEDEDDDL